MSITANTYEEMTIHNVNDRTAEVARQLGEYLLKTWGIYKLSLTVDGNHFGNDIDDSIQEDSTLYTVCSRLSEAKEIALAMRSENDGGANWRLESGFMNALVNDDAILENIVYRSTDYYDTDPEVDMFLFDENGLQQPAYTDSSKHVKDIMRWYCGTPTLRITDTEHAENGELQNTIMSTLTELCVKCFGLEEDELENKIENEWEGYGEIRLSGSITFAGDSIPEMITLLSRLFEQVDQSSTAEIEFEMYAVPDGKDDYNFASVALSYEDGAVKAQYCRF